MSKHTIREIYIAGLKALGATELESRSGKYRTFSVPANVTINGKVFNTAGGHAYGRVYLGKAGAFRAGRTSTTSMDISRSIFAKEAYRLGQLHLNTAGVTFQPADEKISL
jgi:hypothetical protein